MSLANTVFHDDETEMSATDEPLMFELETERVEKLKNILSAWGTHHKIRHDAIMELTREHFLDNEGLEITANDMKHIIACSVEWPEFVNLDWPLNYHLLAIIPDKLTAQVMRALGKFSELHYSKTRNVLRLHRRVLIVLQKLI